MSLSGSSFIGSGEDVLAAGDVLELLGGTHSKVYSAPASVRL
jgi:hypothetical protein